MDSKKVAIIGAGRSGIVSAKYMLQYGLTPYVFEKANEIGGLWAKDTAAWDGLYTNMSKYSTEFVGHPWPVATSIYPSKQEVQDYLLSYAERFNVNKHVFLKHQVTRTKQLENKKWLITSLNLQTNETDSQVFDFLIVSSGLQAKPRIPELKNQNKYEGIIMHSADFRLNDTKLKGKRVIVVGSSHSGVDISAQLVGHASFVVNVFNRTYLVTSRLVKLKNSDNKYKIVPFDFLRRSNYGHKENQTGIEAKRKAFLRSVFPKQTRDRSVVPSALHFDLEDEKQEVLISISDTYIEKVIEGKITPKRNRIREFVNDGVWLESGEFEPADAIIFCTGYDFSFDYFEDSIISILKQENQLSFKYQLILAKYTFNPDIENLALISIVDLVQFRGAELQAKLIGMVFSGKLKLNQDEMRKEIDELRLKISKSKLNKHQSQGPYGSQQEISINLAKFMNIMPNLEKYKGSDPNLYRMFNENVLLSSQFFFGEYKEYTLDLMYEMNEIANRVYEFEQGRDEDDIKVAEVNSNFHQFYKMQNNY